MLPYDTSTAKIYGRVRAELEATGQGLADADLQIAATALHHGLHLVTGNLRHFDRVPGLRINDVLATSRQP
ncbi:MAG: PIN domain-containing protein [Myxococcota bacterium]